MYDPVASVILGFTGTRKGLTNDQRHWLRCHMTTYSEVHHGDCVGADAEVHEVAKSCGCYIVVHPPINSKLRAYCKGDRERQPLEYLERNKAMVAACDVLVAFPGESSEKLHSGTWATIRYAAQVNKPRVIVFPDGDVKVQWPKPPSWGLDARYTRLRNFALTVILGEQGGLGMTLPRAVFAAVKSVKAVEENDETE